MGILYDLVERNVMKVCRIREIPHCFLYHFAILSYS